MLHETILHQMRRRHAKNSGISPRLYDMLSSPPKTAGNAAQFGYFPPMYKNIQKKLDNGQTIILDGGTGTDIQRRGAPMSGETWCADANLTHPDIVRAVHEDYIRCGADIIIANTFATSALLFNQLDGTMTCWKSTRQR